MSAPDQTMVTASSAVSTHWEATDVPVTLDMSWQQTDAAVIVSVEYNSSHISKSLQARSIYSIFK